MSDALTSKLLPAQRLRVAAAYEILAEAWRYAGMDALATIADETAKRFRESRDEPLCGGPYGR